MKPLVFSVLALFLFGAPVVGSSAKPITNDDVIAMVKAGIPESTVILAIQKGPTEFDTSVDTLIALKTAGISGSVIEAMLKSADSTAPDPANATSPITDKLLEDWFTKLASEQSGGLLTVVSCHKRDAQSGQKDGVVFSFVFFDMHIRFTGDCIWNHTPEVSSELTLRATKIPDKNANEWQQMMVVSMNPGRQVSAGTEFLIKGGVRFEKSENGWLVGKAVWSSISKVDESPASAASGQSPIDSVEQPTDSVASRSEEPNPTSAEVFENSLGMRFISIPGAVVRFSVWETRVQDYAAFVSATGREWTRPTYSQTPSHPASGVSCVDAQAFCVWLTEKERAEGVIASTDSYRLPTDEEWSSAVGLSGEVRGTPRQKSAKVTGVYPWGTAWPPPSESGNYFDQTATRNGLTVFAETAVAGFDDGFAFTAPVGSFRPNKYGLFDLGGNLAEWVQDYFNGKDGPRTLRGASYISGYLGPAGSFLSSWREKSKDGRFNNVGFRIVLVRPASGD